MLENVYNSIKSSFESIRESLVGTTSDTPYVPAEELEVDKVDELVNLTNKEMADATKDNVREAVHAASRRANLSLALARDNYSATAPRLRQVSDYLLYIERGLHESDPEDTTDSDGMLLSGIRRVDL